ncbi:hypothetical protein H7H37_20735, partial [Mycolicibacterium insubricum]|nr:hypothetical protein [Mycolicibacterium insubricum]
MIDGLGPARYLHADADRLIAAIGPVLAERPLFDGTAARDAAPNARIVFVDYLTLLPPAGQPARPLSERNAELARAVKSASPGVHGPGLGVAEADLEFRGVDGEALVAQGGCDIVDAGLVAGG